MRQRFLSACLLPAILLYAACSFNTPAVVQAKRQRIYSYNRQGVLTERLAAFILLDDRDGRNDYKNLTLREDSTGLEWMIHRENRFSGLVQINSAIPAACFPKAHIP